MATHTIAQGETLSGIAQKYGMDWREIWKANPNVKNPDKIYAGQALSIPDKGASQTSAGSLEKTLPASAPAAQSPALPGSTPDLTGNQLPAAGGLDQMTLLRRVLANMGTNYTASGMKGGLQATMSGLEQSAGFAPEKVSGNMVGSIIDFVEGQVRKPIENEVQTFADAIDSIAKQQSELLTQQNQLRDDSRQQITQMNEIGAWDNLTPEQKTILWKNANYPGEPVATVSKKNTSLATVNGRVVLVDTQTGSIINDLGKSGSTGNGENLEELLSPSEAATLGVPYGTTKAQASTKGITPKKETVATQAQQTVAGYATRVEQASSILDSLEKTIQGYNQVQFWAEVNSPTQYLRSSTIQQYDQASRNLINAILRPESGAVVSQQEFDNARKQYVPLPGDSDETLKIKRANVKAKFEGYKKAAGPAYSSVNDLLNGTNQNQASQSNEDNDPLGLR